MYKYLTILCFLLCGLSAVKCVQRDVQSVSTGLIDEIKRLRTELLEIRKEFTYKISEALEDKLSPIKSSVERSIDQLKEQTQQSFDQLKIDLKSSTLQLQQDITSLYTSCVLKKEEIQKYSPVINIDNFQEEVKTSLVQLQQGIISLKNSSISMKEEIQGLSPIKLTIDQLKEEVKSSILQLQQNITTCCPSNVLVEEKLKNMTSESDGKSNLPVDLKTGSHCTWNGVNGTCVHSRRCLSTLRGEKHNVCAGSGAASLVCCTDCVLYNDISNAELDPVNGEGIFWKDGSQAKDYNLEYLDKLPYQCRNGTSFKRYFDEEKQCYLYESRVSDDNLNEVTGNEHAYQVVLGIREDPKTIKWHGNSGVIISERFILTSALQAELPWRFAAFGVRHRKDPQHRGWQIHEIKRRIPHPDYIASTQSNDIGLLETKSKIHFSKFVRPACLPSDVLDKPGQHTTWIENDGSFHERDTLRIEQVYRYADQKCSDYFSAYNKTTQMCYGLNNGAGSSYYNYGDPLVVMSPAGFCNHIVAGILSYGFNLLQPIVYTRVSYYVCWIESIMWP